LNSKKQRSCLVFALIVCSITLVLAQGKSIREFVFAGYVHGVPYAEAKAYGPEAIPVLAEILSDQEKKEHWTKAVGVLGYIGDPEAVDVLTAFLSTLQGEVSIHVFRSVLSVPPTLGHLAQHDDRSLEMLIRLAEGNTLEELPLNITFQRYEGESLSEVLGRLAIQGLGISGRPEALVYLEGRRGDIRPDWVDNIEEAIALNRRVQNEGAAEVFDND